MITKIELTNFKSHAHTVIEPGRVTALVGPNGCGKTSVLQAVYVLNQFVRQGVKDGILNWDTIHHFTRKGQDRESIGVKVSGADSWGINVFGSSLLHEKQPDLKAVADLFGQATYFKAIAQTIATPSYTLDIPPVIDLDGSGTASVISYLKNYQEETNKLIEDDLQKVVPGVQRIRVHPVPKLIKEKRTISANGNTLAYDEDKQVNAWELILDTRSGDRLPASLISEGTLVTLALLTLLHTSDAGIFLLDDIEAGLHPLAQRQLMQTLKDFAEKHDRQIILTSHSPYIVDALDAKNVWVMATDKDGISHTKRLSDHPDAKRALEVLATGELWDAEGESWVLENTPTETVNA